MLVFGAVLNENAVGIVSAGEYVSALITGSSNPATHPSNLTERSAP
jgi:hypothetical protein